MILLTQFIYTGSTKLSPVANKNMNIINIIIIQLLLNVVAYTILKTAPTGISS